MAMDLKAQLTMSGGVIALAVALMPVQAQAQNPWMDEAVVAEQAAAQDDAAKEAIANKRAKRQERDHLG